MDGLKNFKIPVVGLYGVPGSGKSFLIRQLKEQLGEGVFRFFEGSDVIASLAEGGLEGFRRMSDDQQNTIRRAAISKIQEECEFLGRVGVVAGHFMFWTEGGKEGNQVITPMDLAVFTHIFYIHVPAEVISQRRLSDKERDRPPASVDHLRKWQNTEEARLRLLCRQNRIIFTVVPHHTCLANRISVLLRNVASHTEENNMDRVQKRLDAIVRAANNRGRIHRMLVFDGDKTLAPVDTGALFWKAASAAGVVETDEIQGCPLKALFGSPMGYSYAAFRQASFLYGENIDDQDFEQLCAEVASMVTIHPEFLSFLCLLEADNNVGAVVLTCGLRQIWEKVLERESLLGIVKVIGTGRVADPDSFIVTANVKAAVVEHLQRAHRTRVWAFGDSTLDLPMLRAADEAIVVVCEEQIRSRSMEASLHRAVDHEGFRARQLLLPNDTKPRLSIGCLPLVGLDDQDFLESIFTSVHLKKARPRHEGFEPGRVRVIGASGTGASQLLMTPMRDARISGPALRKAHRVVGRYMATTYLTEVIGLEESPIPHVQGYETTGFRLRDEEKTLIVPLMRGGEPMALGVNDAFPGAMFLHAARPEDVKREHLEDLRTVILVDSVINTGKSISEFVKHVSKQREDLRIVVVAGVLQDRAVHKGEYALDKLSVYGLDAVVPFRVSENKYTGRGTTDTGNRLFNTVHLA
ncbi:hypothetical protein SODALDRAFT_125524 [Sodiomyces alkalinus F11]|uniref:Phosphoribosyltransferase domain-containing protein n=1 Tax=Sodiomyces alkalinus (strain CBS 110278 / VKM F-3762 / F11) TaxID=1314773 RepID=A0A3N2Q4G2_SODAK|nr:hypothetical protein SODALDRAFT_125524 [Sodiomyces alkalinus F11]ROT41664.1 hypothetical protein SODALDRAFT_125524 [Sodiomyces alkalinus F11]